MKLESVSMKNPRSLNIILGQSHFIKTVEDIHEALVGTVPGIKFGLAFAEASGARLIRTSGTDESLMRLASDNIKALGCGHAFVIVMSNAYPINVLPAIKAVPEVVNLYVASANELEVIVCRTAQGAAIVGVVDGGSPRGVEGEADKKSRKEILREFGYKL